MDLEHLDCQICEGKIDSEENIYGPICKSCMEKRVEHLSEIETEDYVEEEKKEADTSWVPVALFIVLAGLCLFGFHQSYMACVDECPVCDWKLREDDMKRYAHACTKCTNVPHLHFECAECGYKWQQIKGVCPTCGIKK